jgi:hypothetical protein
MSSPSRFCLVGMVRFPRRFSTRRMDIRSVTCSAKVIARLMKRPSANCWHPTRARQPESSSQINSAGVIEI